MYGNNTAAGHRVRLLFGLLKFLFLVTSYDVAVITIVSEEPAVITLKVASLGISSGIWSSGDLNLLFPMM